ncbi:hypothetical protein J2I47_01000 [Fibrella sp. HMF5335]|uniref:Ig-like domain-containing protein n=1 Tax=Fibrella rubiginis TaxID=2817060 RepID=A0A939G9U3_9BACT|nr:choice-of-anchor Q domain-containing protein [Fibrella rubiginis]MBO0935112.1 hypothetical protein [Fibrella rubiginis]
MNKLLRLLPFWVVPVSLLLPQTAHAQVTRYVSTTGSTNPVSATSWAASTNNLQGAINASSAGDMIWVAVGTYKPTNGSDRTLSFSMEDGVAIYGGFRGNEQTLSQRPAVNPIVGGPSGTTLSGDIGTPGDPTDNSFHVISNRGNTRTGLTSTAILDGFVITAGNAVTTNTSNPNADPNNSGGGIYNRSMGGVCSPTIRNCLFQRNFALFGAGGANDGFGQGTANPQLINCLFQTNTAFASGGGLFNNGNQGQSDPVVVNCLFRANEAFSSGGAMYNFGVSGTSDPVMVNCGFLANRAPFGAGLYSDARDGRSRPQVINCSFRDNAATQQGGAMYSAAGLLGVSRPVLTNSVFWDNGGANTFVNNEASITTAYCLFEPTVTGYTAGTGNLTNVTTSPFAGAGSLALTNCSPAINAGNPASQTVVSGPFSATALPTTDLANTPRIVGGRVDMGAFEYPISTAPTRLYVDASAAGTGDGLSWASAFSDLQSALTYPCSQSVTEIWVAAGTYKPTTGTDRNASFALKNGLAIYGGFTGDETSLSQRPRIDPISGQPASSTLSGAIGTSNSSTDNSYHVINNPASLSLTNTAVLDGFVITGGNASGGFLNPTGRGGGIYNEGFGSVCNPTIRNCSFVANQASVGGAICNLGLNGTSSPVITNCFFQSNSAINDGGAIYNDGRSAGNSNPTLINCGFQGNNATDNGGAMHNDGDNSGTSRPALINCSFQANRATRGGAMYNTAQPTGSSRPIVSNSVFWNNGVSLSNGANTFVNSGDVAVEATYSFFDNTVTGYLANPTNLTSVTPTVTRSPFLSTTSVGLNACSPAINAGNPASVTVANGPYSPVNLPATDLAGNPRVIGGRVDMGAVEFTGTPIAQAAITRQPAAGTAVCTGTTITASVSATGTGVNYLWYRDGPSGPVLLTSQTSATLTLPAVTTASTGSYSAVVVGPCNSVTSTAFSLTVSTPPTNLALSASTSTGVASSTLTCAATSLTLTATATGTGLTYAFAGPSGTLAGSGNTRTISASGTYSVTATNATGCFSTTTTPIVSNTTAPTLSVSPTSGTLTCTNPSLTLTAAGTGTAYRWTGGSTGNTLTVNVAGAYSVTATGNNGCTSVSSVTIGSNQTAPTATLVASQTLICTPGSATLTASGGISYLFAGPGLSQSGTSATAVVAQGGAFSVVVTGTNGCSASAGVVISSSPTPGAPALSGASLTVTASPTPILLTTLVTATGGNVLTFTGPSGVVNPPVANINAAGVQTFSVVQTSPAGCVSPATVFSLTVLSPQPPSSQTLCRGSQVVLDVLPNGVRYEWYRNGQTAANKLINVVGVQLGTTTASLTLVSVQTNATYYSKVFAADGSFTWAGPFVITVNAACGGRRSGVAGEPVTALSVQLLPNPITNSELRAVVTGATGNALLLTLWDGRGQLVRQQAWAVASASEEVIWDLRQHPAGMYLLKAQAAEQLITVKVLKIE